MPTHRILRRGGGGGGGGGGSGNWSTNFRWVMEGGIHAGFRKPFQPAPKPTGGEVVVDVAILITVAALLTLGILYHWITKKIVRTRTFAKEEFFIPEPLSFPGGGSRRANEDTVPPHLLSRLYGNWSNRRASLLYSLLWLTIVLVSVRGVWPRHTGIIRAVAILVFLIFLNIVWIWLDVGQVESALHALKRGGLPVLALSRDAHVTPSRTHLPYTSIVVRSIVGLLSAAVLVLFLHYLAWGPRFHFRGSVSLHVLLGFNLVIWLLHLFQYGFLWVKNVSDPRFVFRTSGLGLMNSDELTLIRQRCALHATANACGVALALCYGAITLRRVSYQTPSSVFYKLYSAVVLFVLVMGVRAINYTRYSLGQIDLTMDALVERVSRFRQG